MGYTYVMSDIHGMYELFMKMLEQINFSEDDQLYIIGDMIDRGEQPLEVLEFVKSRDNIHPLKGNHEAMICECYKNIKKGNMGEYFYNTYIYMSSRYEEDVIDEWMQWMEKLPLYKDLTVNGQRFILAHASTKGIAKGKIREQEILWNKDFVLKGDNGSEDYISIVGHTPTPYVRFENYGKTAMSNWRVWNDENIIDIDCGACFGNALACLCLDTMKDYYVEDIWNRENS